MVKRERKPNNARPKRSNYHSSKPKIKKPKKSKSKSKSESAQKLTTKAVVSINPKNKNKNKNKNQSSSKSKSSNNLQPIAIESSSQDLNFFLHQYQSANGVQLSSLELESISDACVLKLSESLSQDASTLGEHMKASFGASWKELLCAKQLPEGKSEPGSPVLLTISLSALRSLELLRGLRPLTEECHAAKLFSKHMKVEEQVSVLKNHVNIGCGTPSRIKKLIDVEALGLSRLAVVVLDMQPDVKGYSLFTLPQVRDEFWDLYKCYFHPRLLVGNLRLCLYGDIPASAPPSKKTEDVADEPMTDEPMNE